MLICETSNHKPTRVIADVETNYSPGRAEAMVQKGSENRQAISSPQGISKHSRKVFQIQRSSWFDGFSKLQWTLMNKTKNSKDTTSTEKT